MNTRCALALVAAAAMTSAALADDFAPPWFRGEQLSIQAEWEWASPPADLFFMAPDVFIPVGGTVGGVLYPGFPTHAEVEFPADWRWLLGDGDGGLTPTNPNGANIIFNVQNWVDEEPIKYLRIQITHQGLPPQVVSVTGFLPGTPGAFDGGLTIDDQHFYSDWRMLPNPSWEQVVVNVPFGTVLDEVVIDSVSVPAPAGALLFAIVAAGAGRRRRD